MDRIVDLDLAAAEIALRKPGWQARGLIVGPVTWRDEASSWPQPLETDRTLVREPDSVGVQIYGPHGTGLVIVLFRGGWADLNYDAGGEDYGALPTPRLTSASDVGDLLDSCVARVWKPAP